MNTITKWILITLSLLMSFQLFSQVNYDNTDYKRLYYVCKAWGHAKYFHTEIAKGNIDWDYELITALNGIKDASDNIDFNNSLLTLLKQAGEMGISSGTLPNVPDSLNNNNDQAWMSNSILSDSVKAILDTIRNKFRPQSNVYVGEAWAGGNPTFDTDNLYYSGTVYPSENKRIFALFRYWNIINYFYPYKNIMDQN